MPDQAKNMLIGIFVFAACAIVIFVLMFIHPSVGDHARLLRVRFSNIDKISVGTRVTFAGKPVGEVIAIQELPDVETERKAINGVVYVYELTLRVDSTVSVFNTDDVSSRTSGLLGEKSVAINPNPSNPGEKIFIVNDEILYANEAGSVEDTLKGFRGLAEKVDLNLDIMSEALTTLRKDKFWENLGKLSDNLAEISESLNKNSILWPDTIANLNTISNQVKETTSKISQGEGTIGKMVQSDELYARFNHLTEQAGMILSDTRTVTKKISQGEGTVGKVLNNDDLYMRLVALTNKGETILNDVNHYGILFQLDKGWQRLRARRMNLMLKLRSPQEFRNYFNDEVDQITTSIARVSMVLGQVECQPEWCSCNLLRNTEFVKVYSELIRRVDAIDEAIKMYNQQVVDTAVDETELDPCCQ